jgi:hypothetical protein
MKYRTLYLVVLAVLLLSTACVQQGVESLAGGSESPRSEQTSGDDIQLQQEGIGPIEITPLPPGQEPSPAPPGAGGGNISSQGERTAGEISDSQPGMIDSKAPGELTLEEQVVPAVNWLTYRDQDFGFVIEYPDAYVILEDPVDLAGSQPGLLGEIRFLDRQLAAADTADLEIPGFRIEVYELGDNTLESFLEDNLPRGRQESYELGDLSGVRATLNQMIAPHEFYYFADQGYVYRLTPLGEYGQQMLESFQIE